jgi:hypothetical protein
MGEKFSGDRGEGEFGDEVHRGSFMVRILHGSQMPWERLSKLEMALFVSSVVHHEQTKMSRRCLAAFVARQRAELVLVRLSMMERVALR